MICVVFEALAAWCTSAGGKCAPESDSESSSDSRTMSWFKSIKGIPSSYSLDFRGFYSLIFPMRVHPRVGDKPIWVLQNSQPHSLLCHRSSSPSPSPSPIMAPAVVRSPRCCSRCTPWTPWTPRCRRRCQRGRKRRLPRRKRWKSARSKCPDPDPVIQPSKSWDVLGCFRMFWEIQPSYS